MIRSVLTKWIDRIVLFFQRQIHMNCIPKNPLIALTAIKTNSQKTFSIFPRWIPSNPPLFPLLTWVQTLRCFPPIVTTVYACELSDSLWLIDSLCTVSTKSSCWTFSIFLRIITILIIIPKANHSLTKSLLFREFLDFFAIPLLWIVQSWERSHVMKRQLPECRKSNHVKSEMKSGSL